MSGHSINGNTGDVRFFTKYPNGMKVDRRFKVSDMIYEGQLEYQFSFGGFHRSRIVSKIH